MTKKATLQVRMDADLKEKAEELYRNLGTSFAEAVRIFAKQSIQENKMPFAIVDKGELDELDKQKAMNQLLLKLQEAEKSVRVEGTISADDLEAELEVL